MRYNEKIKSEGLYPKNTGRIIDPDGIGDYSGENDGDRSVFFIKVKNKRIVEVKYQVYGCLAAIASCSATSLLVEGRLLKEALRIDDGVVDRYLEGFPEHKKICSNIGSSALRLAIKDYYERLKTNA